MTATFEFRLDPNSGVPFYRQLIDQVLIAIASNGLSPGDQLPTVRQLAVDLQVNPNTIVRAYREMEIRGILTTQQGSGTFIAKTEVKPDEAERQRRLSRLVGDLVARAGAEGFKVEELIGRLQEMLAERRRPVPGEEN